MIQRGMLKITIMVIILIMLLTFSIVAISPSVVAENGFEEDDGGFHVAFMALAGLLGLLAVLSGMRNSRIKWISDLFPKMIPRIFHRWLSVAYYAVYFGTFVAWSLVFYGDKGEIYYTLHGQIGLISVVLAILGIITGIVMWKRPLKLWRLHWVFNMTSFLLMVLTMILGLALED